MKKLVIANWKSNKSLSQAEEWLANLKTDQVDLNIVTPVIAPAYPFLAPLSPTVTKLGWQLAAQNISPFPSGSYTGAVSNHNLKDLAIKYVIVGHSERRKYFNETDQLVSQKIDQALELGATPIICVDENTLASQAAAMASEVMDRCMVVYEPVGSIGNGNNASLADVQQFKAKVSQLFGPIPFLYGGSVDEQNVGEYLLETDGVLVGTASLVAAQFINLLQAAQGVSPADL